MAAATAAATAAGSTRGGTAAAGTAADDAAAACGRAAEEEVTSASSFGGATHSSPVLTYNTSLCSISSKSSSRISSDEAEKMRAALASELESNLLLAISSSSANDSGSLATQPVADPFRRR